jgi:putative chitobiose transport system permease protein
MTTQRPLWLNGLLYALALVCALIALGPAIWLLYAACRPAGEPLTSLYFSGFTLSNFKIAWTDGGLGRPMMTSVLLTLLRAVLNVLLAALAAYPLARMKFAGKSVLLSLILATMMVPEQVVVVPVFRTVVSLGMYDSLIGVLLPYSVTAFGIYLCRNAFAAVPHELEEAARIDGASVLGIFVHVMLPLSAPTLATLALFSAIGAWSDLLWPLVVLNSREQYTLPVALAGLMGQFSTNMRAAFAGSVIALAPIVILFLIIQRFFKPEIFAGGVKG